MKLSRGQAHLQRTGFNWPCVGPGHWYTFGSPLVDTAVHPRLRAMVLPARYFSGCLKHPKCVYLSLEAHLRGRQWIWWPFCLLLLVAQSCPTLCDLRDCSPPGSSVHGILQARILEWVAIPFCRGSSWPTDWTSVSSIVGRFFTVRDTRKAPLNAFIRKTAFPESHMTHSSPPLHSSSLFQQDGIREIFPTHSAEKHPLSFSILVSFPLIALINTGTLCFCLSTYFLSPV